MRIFIRSLIFLLAFYLFASGQTISGFVTDALTNAPVRGAKISVVELSRECTASPEGEYHTGVLKPGSFTFRVEAEGYLTVSKRIHLASPNEVGASDMEKDIALFKINTQIKSDEDGLKINYYFPGHGDVNINVYNQKGEKIRYVFDKSKNGGLQQFVWNGKDNAGNFVPPGTYEFRIQSRNMITIKKLHWAGRDSLGNAQSNKENSQTEKTDHKPHRRRWKR